MSSYYLCSHYSPAVHSREYRWSSTSFFIMFLGEHTYTLGTLGHLSQTWEKGWLRGFTSGGLGSISGNQGWVLPKLCLWLGILANIPRSGATRARIGREAAGITIARLGDVWSYLCFEQCPCIAHVETWLWSRFACALSWLVADWLTGF